MESDDEVCLWKPEPRHVQERIREFGKVLSTSDMQDFVKNLADAEGKPRKVESKEFQRYSTIQIEIVMVITDMWGPTVGAMARLMRVMSCCNKKPTSSWRKPWLLVDADSVSDESTRNALSQIIEHL